MSGMVVPIRFPESRVTIFAPSVVLLGAMILSYILPAEYYTGVLIILYLCYLVFSPGSVNALAIKLAAPFIALGILGFIMSGDNLWYLALKDGWYVLKLCLCLMLGLLLGVREQRSENLHRSIIIFAVVASIGVIAVVPLLQNFLTGAGDGEESNLLPLAALGAIPILLTRISRSEGGFRWRDVILLLLLMTATVVSNSRITLISMLIMFLAAFAVFATIKRAAIGGAVALTAGTILWQFLPEYNGGDLNVLTKLRRSLDEMVLTDAYDPRTMLLNWRGFEAYNAQLMFSNAEAYRKILGFGFGAEVDLGQAVQMSQEMVYRYLPTIHNGFYFVLIKFGIVGVVVYAAAVSSWFRWGRGKFADGWSLNDRILRGQICIVIASTAVITGLFNKFELHGVTLLTAYIIGMGYRRLSDYSLAADNVESGNLDSSYIPQVSI